MTFSHYGTHDVVIGELVRKDSEFRDQWNDWKANRAYRERRNKTYSPGRLFTEALAYSVLLTLVRWALGGLLPQFFSDWVDLASQATLALSIGFGAIATLAAFAWLSDGLELFHGGTSGIWKLDPVPDKPALKIIKAQDVERTSSKPPTLPGFMLELLVPRRDRATLIGDLEEEYTYDLLPRYGRGLAAFWYWIQCMREILFYLWPLLKKGLPWGIIAASAAKFTWLSEILHQITK